MIFERDALQAVGVAAVILGGLYYFILYPVFLSPLSKVPAAHPLASITSLWIQWQRYRHRELDCVRTALAKKGDYVRLSPNEIVVNTVEGIQNVYGVGKHNLDKPKSYEYFITHGHRNMFTALDRTHQSYRRRISAVYSNSALQTSPHVRKILRTVLLERLLPLWRQSSLRAGDSVDMLPVLQSYAIDFMSSFIFGLRQGTNFVQDVQARQHWLDLYNWAYPSSDMFWLLEAPLLGKVLCALGLKLLPKEHKAAVDELEVWATLKVQETEAALVQSLKSGVPLAAGELPILYTSIRDSMDHVSQVEKTFVPSQGQMDELASECYDHIVATRDVFGTAFSYVVYEISRHPEAQRRLYEELTSIDTPFIYPPDSNLSTDGMPTPASLSRLPYLNAVIKEGLRLRNTTPNMDPRMTPSGRLSDIGPYKHLPPGIRAGAFAYLIHRRDDLYENAETWNPDRWLSQGEGNLTERKNGWSFAFSDGSRGCVGQQTAMELMRFALAAIYTNFTTSVADESQYPGTKGFVSGQNTEKLFIRFESVKA